MSSVFRAALQAAQPIDDGGRTWLFVAYDQLNDQLGPLATLDPADAGIVLVESLEKSQRRPYHQRKLALVLANLRHFAVEQAQRGVAVHHVVTEGGYAEALRAVARERGPLRMMRAAERELRDELQPLVDTGLLLVEDHTGWLTTAADFARAGGPEGPWRMDGFYRAVRQRTGWLMDTDGHPFGGKYSHDADNRKRWPGDPPEPLPPRFEASDIKAEVVALVRQRFAHHPGEVHAEELPATAADAAMLWSWALGSCLHHFGPFEDAMSASHRRLFHTKVSELLNLHRLRPQQLVDDVLAHDELPLSSREGFLRQVAGWREFVRHVHEATDGFRRLTDDGTPTPNALQSHEPLPDVFWGAPSGLACLDGVVADVWRDGWSHHIPRLMVLSNLATLLDVSPRELTDWFWVAYADAYDWVVEPNVLGMGTFAAGDVMTTKPYVSGANYLHKMSDYCAGCAFHPKKTCPITPMYWAFLNRKRPFLEGNRRMNLPLASAARRSDAQRQEDRARTQQVLRALRDGRVLSPDDDP